MSSASLAQGTLANLGRRVIALVAALLVLTAARPVRAVEPDAAAGAAAATDAGAEPDAGAGAAAEPDAGAEPGAGAEPDAGAGAGAAADPDAPARVIAEDVQAQMARAREALAERAKQSSEREERARGLIKEAEAAQADGAAALLDRVLAELPAARQGVEEALQDAAAPPSAPSLIALSPSVRDEAEALDRSAREGAAQRLEASLRAAAQLDAARLLLLRRLDSEARDAALGVSRAGFEQLRWEVWRAGARLRGAQAQREALRREALDTLRDPFFWPALVKRLFAVALVIAGAVLLLRRRPHVARATAWLVALAGERPRLVRWIEGAGAALSALWPALIRLAALRALLEALGREAAASAIVQQAYGWLALLLGYQLALAAVEHWIRRTSGTPGGDGARATDLEVLRSIRRAGRYALGSALVLSAVELPLGAGIVHYHADRVVALGWIWTVGALLRAWQDDLFDLYLRRRSRGALAGLIRRAGGGRSGMLLVPLASAALLGRAAGGAIYRYSLRFEQVHRLLALVFRKRLERLAGVSSDGRAAPLDLPEDLCRHFSEDAIEDPAKGIDVWPGMKDFERVLADWRAERAVGTVLLVGGFGSGKTSCLHAMKARLGDTPWRHVPLGRRMMSGAELLATFAAELGAPPEATASARAFAAWLVEQPRRALVLDDLEHLFLRGVDTWSAWSTFLELVERSGHHMFWLCAIAQQPYRYLCFARRESADLFRLTIPLIPWTEQQITDLLRARMKAAGYEASFAGVVVGGEEITDEERLRRAEQEFMRLLWDYAAGCPRVAMHFWLRSLGRDPEAPRRVLVRLFPAPREDDLEVLNETERFVLAGVVWHDSLTTSEAVASFRYPELPCEAALARLRELGLIDHVGGRHRVTTHWHSTITAYLVRKHLIDP